MESEHERTDVRIQTLFIYYLKSYTIPIGYHIHYDNGNTRTTQQRDFPILLYIFLIPLLIVNWMAQTTSFTGMTHHHR